MNREEYPYRESVMLSDDLKLIVWRNAQMTESQTEICQRNPASDRPVNNVSDGDWIVRARFLHVGEAIKYLQSIKLIIPF